MQGFSPPLRKPDWLKVRLPGGEPYKKVHGALKQRRLYSVCQEARCPNIAECFDDGTATFLILGDTCTRNCRYCRVAHGIPAPPDPDEPSRILEAVRALGLRYVVITSVTRDDLADGGAGHFAACIGALREQLPGCPVEVLIPDFHGSRRALRQVMAAGPAVINHNLEVAPPLFKDLRPQGNYSVSLELLRRISEEHGNNIVSKSGFMVGFGESHADILALMEDLAGVHCERLTIGQYQQPTRKHWPVRKFYHPDEFEAFKAAAAAMGFRHVEAGP
ncbi:MAG: lipoyl synthase, partial [Syntrophus sp. (in: bacteria)]|nr:lipoyl synthase [Syntrophus sp. (in: bacteria)]